MGSGTKAFRARQEHIGQHAVEVVFHSKKPCKPLASFSTTVAHSHLDLYRRSSSKAMPCDVQPHLQFETLQIGGYESRFLDIRAGCFSGGALSRLVRGFRLVPEGRGAGRCVPSHASTDCSMIRGIRSPEPDARDEVVQGGITIRLRFVSSATATLRTHRGVASAWGK